MREDVLLTPGQLLVMAREALSKTQADIAQQLHLTVERINDIEENAFDKIGIRTFVRGYLCSYARLVGVAQTHILEAFDAMDVMPEFKRSSPAVIEGAPVRNVTHQSYTQKWDLLRLRSLGTGILLLLLVGFFWYFYRPNNVTVVEPAKTLPVVVEPYAPVAPAPTVVPVKSEASAPKKTGHAVVYTISPVLSDEVSP